MPYVPGYKNPPIPFTEVPDYVFMVYYQSADSYHSVPHLPIAAFGTEQAAIDFAKAQPGYGYGIDWKVESLSTFVED